MKQIITITIFFFYAINTNAQLNIGGIMNEINKNGQGYSIAGTMTVLQNTTSRTPTSSHLNVTIAKTPLTHRRGSDYIQANATAIFRELFSDRENEMRIYIHQNSNVSNKEDVQSIKINWKTSSGEIVGVLSNINIFYEPDGMLITGTFQKENKSYGINLAITK